MREINSKWISLEALLIERFGKKPDLQAILFLIGVDELGQTKHKFTKEEKQDLIHVGICKVLSYSDYYEFLGIDEEGWPHWKNTRKLPQTNLLEQEELLKAHVIYHFEEINFLSIQ